MARKKIVFVIVEGPSDDEALGVLLTKIFDKSKVFVYIVHGDITTNSGVNHTNICAKIGSIVNEYAKSNHLTKQHFQEIVHIVDTDGAYIPSNSIILDETAEKTFYTLTGIHTVNTENIKKRNDVKRKCLDKISSVKSIANVPYQVYYMSCNLDHVLFDNPNSTDEEKEDNSLAFALKYKDNIKGFIDFMIHSPFSVTDEYLASWRFIKAGLNSLERHTNLGICLKNAAKSNDP